MKKTIFLFAITLTLCLASVAARAATTGDPPTKEAIAAMTPEERQARVAEIQARVTELKAQDRSQMTREQRKAYRAELKGLRQETKMYDVLYIGVGAAVILILILLIIF